MKLIKTFLISGLILSIITFTSCNQDEIDRLTLLNSELREQNRISDSLQNVFLSYVAAIEVNIEEIKAKEKSISEANMGKGYSREVLILKDIEAISELLDENREKLKNLTSIKRQLMNAKATIVKLKEENTSLRNQLEYSPRTSTTIVDESENSESQRIANERRRLEQEKNQLLRDQENAQNESSTLAQENANYKAMIDKLKIQLIESQARIESLQEELFMLKEAYANLQIVADSLRVQNDVYRGEIEKNMVTIRTQAEIINTAYYAVGTAKELKTKSIINKDGINNLYPTNVYSKVDVSETKSIETHSSKVKILSNHPYGTYRINNSDRKNYKIEIINPELFWKGNRYLVIMVK